MSARVEVHRIRSRLDDTLARGKAMPAIESQADYARHFCVLVSGLIERAAQLALMDYSSRTAAPAVQSYVEHGLSRFTNAKSGRLVALFGQFDKGWGHDLDAFLIDERKDAVNSVVSNRHNIAHGHSVSLSLGQIEAYYKQVLRVVEKFLDVCGCA